jgi:hypothetical protein
MVTVIEQTPGNAQTLGPPLGAAARVVDDQLHHPGRKLTVVAGVDQGFKVAALA